jgi:hypothetical protein
MRMYTSIEYLRKMPVTELLDIVNEIVEADKEREHGK